MALTKAASAKPFLLCGIDQGVVSAKPFLLCGIEERLEALGIRSFEKHEI